MYRITRYLLSQMTLGLVLVTSGLVAVVWLSQSLRFIEKIVNKGLSAAEFLFVTGLLLSDFLALIIPVALFTVVVFVYARLVADRELVAMTGAGLSPLRLGSAAIILGLAVVVVECLLYLYVIPTTSREFKSIQYDLRFNYYQILLQEGVFNNVTRDVSVYIREKNRQGELLGFLVHDARDTERPATVIAERGALLMNKSGPRVVMFNGNRQVVERKTDDFSILYFDSYTFDLKNTVKALPKRRPEARELPLSALFAALDSGDLSDKAQALYLIDGHNRLTAPFHGLLYALLALACLVSGDFTRRGQTRRILLAIGLVVLHVGAHLGVMNACARYPSLIPLIYLNTWLPIGAVGLFLFRGARFGKLPRLAEAR